LATEIHLQLLPLFKALLLTTNPVPLKIALAQQGWPVGAVRSPLCMPDESVNIAIAEVLLQLSNQGILGPSL
jgi:4-hydroxy-tetrahydrodipicolinate synthase